MKRLSLAETQKVSASILQTIDRVCREQGLTYWLMYGTLLGAIRHGGFIPWDDDVDVALPRKDYDRFLEYFRTHQEGPLEIHTWQGTEGYPFYISRLCHNDYYVKFRNRTYTSGVFVDIYPFDGMGNDRQYWFDMRKKILRIRKHLTLSCYPSMIYGNGITHKIGNIPNMIYSKHIGREHFLRQLETIEQTFSWEESRYVSVPAWDPEVWFFKKEWFDETRRVPFQGMMVNIPAGYDGILTERYGNYMELPPVEQRVPQHDYHAYKKG